MNEIRKRKANPGGSIAVEDIVGRDRLVEQLWQTLEQQSLVLVAERRIGKSCVIRKMRSQEPAGVLTFSRDVENVETPLEFVERVYHDVEGHLGRWRRAVEGTRSLLREIAGVEIGGVVKFPSAAAPHWKRLLETVVQDLIERQDRKIVLFWDEFPGMLQKIKKTSGEAAAVEVLDTLRCLRQAHTGLRMVYTGSIGLHHVTSALAESGNAHAPLNDMRIVEVPPISLSDAESLAVDLLRGEGLICADPQAAARAIAIEVDCIPYYIHLVLTMLKARGDVAEADLVRQIVTEALVDPEDHWHLQHYRVRLESYYGADRAGVALILLDELAVGDGSITFDELSSRLSVQLTPDRGETAQRVLGGDRELLRRLLTLLQRDHYLQQDSSDGAYGFRFPLIKRWWRLQRNLGT